MNNSHKKLSNLSDKEECDPFDLTKLPSKYLFNEEKLSENKFIDDNSLFAYYCISRELFCDKKKLGMRFLFLYPFEWTSIDFIAFLLYASKNYNLKIENISTIIPAVQENYEKTYEPRTYKGAYKWLMELKKKEPSREEVLLFDKFANKTVTISDLERLIIYADRFAGLEENEINEASLSKNIFREILNYTKFSFSLDSIKKSTLKSDMDLYLEAFMQDNLVRNTKDKKVGNTSTYQSQNIYTFKKHSDLFSEYLRKMQNDFGNILTIENKFEERFPNLEYPEAEFIRKRYAERRFFFIHTLLAFEKQGLIKICYLGNNWDYHEDHMLTYIAKIEILPKFINEDLSKNLSFDEELSRFYVKGKEIKLYKFKNEYHILRIMFENPEELSKEWFFSEIGEKIDSANLSDKKYYNAIDQLKSKLAKNSINDFFITTKQSVKINPKYLS